MDVRQLQIFIAIAEEGSIHGGARRMMMAQPALSKLLRALERELGAGLVQRSPRGIELTTAGNVLLEQAYEIVGSLDKTIDMVREVGRGQQTLTVGLLSGAAAGAELTTDIIRGFQLVCPSVTVTVRELHFANQFSSTADGTVDVALVRLPVPDDRVDALALFAEPLLLTFRSDHHLATRSGITVEEFLDETMLGMAGAPQPWTDFWQMNGIRHSIPKTGASVQTLAEMQFALLTAPQIVMPMTAAAWRMSSQYSDLRALRILDGPQSTAAVISRPNENREHVLAFIEHARVISKKFLGKVPGATLPFVGGLPPAPVDVEHNLR